MESQKKPEQGYSNAHMRGESPEELEVLDSIAKGFEQHVEVLRGNTQPKQD